MGICGKSAFQNLQICVISDFKNLQICGIFHTLKLQAAVSTACEVSALVFRRKIYDRLLSWKKERQGKTALLIEGARRVGKSTIVEEFARNEYRSYILIDFSLVSRQVTDLFDDLTNLDFLFLGLQAIFQVDLHERESLIIFDEVQFCPRARQAIKALVKDHRYDYIETGSLISIQKNVRDILIPSEEERIRMYPMDYEEFSLAVNGNDCSMLKNFQAVRLTDN